MLHLPNLYRRQAGWSDEIGADALIKIESRSEQQLHVSNLVFERNPDGSWNELDSNRALAYGIGATVSGLRIADLELARIDLCFAIDADLSERLGLDQLAVWNLAGRRVSADRISGRSFATDLAGAQTLVERIQALGGEVFRAEAATIDSAQQAILGLRQASNQINGLLDRAQSELVQLISGKRAGGAALTDSLNAAAKELNRIGRELGEIGEESSPEALDRRADLSDRLRASEDRRQRIERVFQRQSSRSRQQRRIDQSLLLIDLLDLLGRRDQIEIDGTIISIQSKPDQS